MIDDDERGENMEHEAIVLTDEQASNVIDAHVQTAPDANGKPMDLHLLLVAADHFRNKVIGKG